MCAYAYVLYTYRINDDIESTDKFICLLPTSNEIIMNDGQYCGPN